MGRLNVHPTHHHLHLWEGWHGKHGVGSLFSQSVCLGTKVHLDSSRQAQGRQARHDWEGWAWVGMGWGMGLSQVG